MNGPQIVCAGCGAATGLYAPLCDQCARNYVELVGEVPSCALCDAGLPVKHGMHTTKTGGYAGKCAAIFESSLTSNEGQS